jgi:nucleoid-associated protein YgaU
MDRFEELKGKYSAALKVLGGKGFRMHNLHVQDNKLFVKASAGTHELKDMAWNEIKKADRAFADLTCDIGVDPSIAPPPEPKTYTVVSGDTLSKVAKQFYGDANKYMKIFEANKDQLKDPNMIRVGQVLKIPE